ncbi:MAG TPA: hypothetical protein VIW71_23470 [Streptomyces sp.]
MDPTIVQEMRYFTSHNFTGAPIDGYRKPVCILTRSRPRTSTSRWSAGL